MEEGANHSSSITPPDPPPQRSPPGTSAGSQSQSRIPRKLRNKQPVHILMDLTETQMDRITDALTNKVSSSPLRGQGPGMTPSKSTPLHANGAGLRSGMTPEQHRANKSMDLRSLHSPTFTELMPRHGADSMGLAERRRREPPPPIHVGAVDHWARKLPQRPLMQAVPDLISPLSAKGEERYEDLTDLAATASSYDIELSVYSPQTFREANHQRNDGLQSSSAHGKSKIDDEVLKMCREWVRNNSSADSIEAETQPASHLRGNHYLSPAMRLSCNDEAPPTPSPLPRPPPPLAAPRIAASRKAETPMFSPLPLYFRGQGFPTVKKGEKTMIGQNGWLERTRSPEKQKQTPQKKTRILDSIKKIAKDMSEQYNTSKRVQPITRDAVNAQIFISLDTREQSLLYCELEFHITTALNDYIATELDKGHLVPDNLKKISDWWYQQGRPKVIGFRYDMETQLELINLHLNDFAFHGRRQSNSAEVAGLLHAMKVNARAMRIRTFCQPDSVIAKQLVDTQSLFNLVNATNSQQIALAEVAQFFKVILERERDNRSKRACEPRQSIG